MGLAGKKRKEETAENIVSDISKILFFHNEHEVQWENITNTKKLLKYMDKMESCNVGPEGQLTKLERVCLAFEFLKMNRPKDTDLRNQLLESEMFIERWKKTLRTEKNALQVRRREDASEMDMNMETISEVVDNPNMWSTFSDIVEEARYGQEVPEKDLKLVMGIVMVAVMLKSYQRPGAVKNCTIAEYMARAKHDDVTIIKVREHKTGSQGAAKLTMDTQLEERLKLYFKYRPLLTEPGNDVDRLFILPGSKPVGKFGNLKDYISKRINTDIPTATEARKIGTTCAARVLDYQTNILVTKQMSHQPEVSRKYYEAIHGSKDTAFAFHKLEALREASKTQQPTQIPSTPAAANDLGTHSRWSSADTKFVRKKFARHIKNKQTPRLDECSELGISKSQKQVQDKIRTLIRQHARNEIDEL